MRLILVAIALCAAMTAHAGPALQGDDITLQGQWQYAYLSVARVSGVIVIDPQHKAVLNGKWTGGIVAPGSVRETGHVRIQGTTVEIVFTSAVSTSGPYNTDHFRCLLISSDAMDCYNADVAGSVSDRFILRRIGAQ